MHIGAVVLHYRYWPNLRPALDQLFSGDRRPDVTIVVDNHSGDGSAGAITAAYPGTEVVEARDNLGYAGGMNLGAERVLAARAEAVLLLTHDCHLAVDALARLEQRLEEAAEVGVVGPVMGFLSRPDRVFSAGAWIEPRTWETVLCREPPLVDQWAGAPPCSRDWMTGSCLLVRAAAMREAGPMDEAFFLYFEEVDYQLTLRRLGWRVECVPSALAWQEPGRIPVELGVRNRLRFLARHAPSTVLARELVRQALYAGHELLGGEAGRTAARVRGVARFTFRRWGPLPARSMRVVDHPV